MSSDDNDLRTRALAALRVDDKLDAARLDLDVEVRDSLAVLTGTVQQPWQKFRAQWVLEQLPEIETVENLVLMEPVYQRTDDEIRQELIETFLQDPYLDERAIEPVVQEGVVHLKGRVPSFMRQRLAGVVAWWRAGVRDVVNELEVDFPEPDSNEELAEAVKVALEKDPLVDGSAVGIRIIGRGDVTLVGRGGSPEQREAAENDTWCVLGVHSVDNQLEVIPQGVPQGRLEQEGDRHG